MIALARAAALVACCVVLGCAATERSSSPQRAGAGFEFAALGDAPYNSDEEERFVAMLGELNRERLAFVVHVGDFKSGHSECSDEVFRQRREWFALSHHPFVFIPGDNDWTDCWRTMAGAYRPTERLERLRTLFFDAPRSHGQRSMDLVQQSHGASPRPYPEHLRWVHRGVLFATVNVPGGDNNLARDRAEFQLRDTAVRGWIDEAFRLARAQRITGIAIMMQANPWAAAGPRRDGYAPLLEELRRQSLNFPGEVVLIHGDTHRFRVDRPLVDPVTGQIIGNFTRIEVFGSPSVNWVRVSVTDEGGRVKFSAAPGS